jgi:hypothetical protein
VPSIEIRALLLDRSNPLYKTLIRDNPKIEAAAFLFTKADISRLRKLVDGNATVEKEHVKGTNWTVKELAKAWNLSPDTIREKFKAEEGIVKLERPGTRKKRAYVTFTIPEGVADRVKRRMS